MQFAPPAAPAGDHDGEVALFIRGEGGRRYYRHYRSFSDKMVHGDMIGVPDGLKMYWPKRLRSIVILPHLKHFLCLYRGWRFHQDN